MIAPEDVAAAQQAIIRHSHFYGNSATAFGFANSALKAVGYASLKARIEELEGALREIAAGSSIPITLAKNALEAKHD